MADKTNIDTGAVKGKADAKTIAVISAALGMFLQNEKFDFKILNIQPVHSSDLNLWGLSGRMKNMDRLTKTRWK